MHITKKEEALIEQMDQSREEDKRHFDLGILKKYLEDNFSKLTIDQRTRLMITQTLLEERVTQEIVENRINRCRAGNGNLSLPFSTILYFGNTEKENMIKSKMVDLSQINSEEKEKAAVKNIEIFLGLDEENI